MKMSMRTTMRIKAGEHLSVFNDTDLYDLELFAPQVDAELEDSIQVDVMSWFGSNPSTSWAMLEENVYVDNGENN